jgi:alpha-glucosidase (family GH31 glycosyl hydrolase)
MFARYPDLAEVIAELRDEGVRVTAYVNPYLNVKGDIFTQNENEQIWLTDDQGETLIQDFGQFKVKIVKATV